MTYRKLSALMLFALPIAVISGAPVDAESNYPAKTIQGSWTGDFGAGNWTFKFDGSGGGWSGQYSYPQYKGWNPVINLKASGQAAQFSLKAKTAVDFDLKLDPSGEVLAGSVRFARGKTADSPPVKLPVQFKRI